MGHSYFLFSSLRKNLGNVKGVNRAFPYVATDDVDSVIEEHTPVLFKLVRTLFVIISSVAIHFVESCFPVSNSVCRVLISG